MRHQKGSAHVLIITGLVALLLAALGFIFWQNFIHKSAGEKKSVAITEDQTTADTDPYEGWKNYSSDRDGYSIKYPAEWFLTPESADDGPYIRNFDSNTSSEGPRDGEYSGYPLGAKYLRVLVDKNENGKKNASDLSTVEWYNKLGQVDLKNGVDSFLAKDVRETNANGMIAKSAKSVFTETNEVIFILKGTDLYGIWLYPYGSMSDSTMKMIVDSLTISSN